MSDAHDASDYNQLSIFEELDPEPGQNSGASRAAGAREFLLGFVLLMSVLAWAGWQWWYQETVSGAYRVAQEAAAREDWDAAYTGYRDASGYRDADVRAGETARLITERDRRYSAALGYSQQGEWFAALSELREVARIQPDYPDAEGLRQRVERGTREFALNGIGGTIASVDRTASRPVAGLYYIAATGSGWTWLEGSDLWSGVQDAYVGGPIIYDVPGPGLTRPLPLASSAGWSSDEEYRQWLEQRRFMVMWLEGDRPHFDLIPRDPSDSYFMAGPNGVWHVGRSARSRSELHEEFITSFPSVAYQPLGGPGSDVTARLGPDIVVVDSLSKSGRVLLAELSSSGEVSGTNRVYIAGPDGSDRRLVHSFQGDLRNAQLSQDGRYVLLTVFEAQGDLPGSQSVLLVDSQDGSSHILARKELSTIWSGQPTTQFVGASFIDKGPFRGKVVAGEWGWDSKLRIFDPSRPQAEPLSIPIEGDVGCCRPLVLVWGGEGVQAGSMSLMGAGPSGDIVAGANTLTVVRLITESPQGKQANPSVATTEFKLINIPLDIEDQVSPVLVRGDYLVYWVWKPSVRGVYSIRSIPVSELGQPLASPLEVYSGSLPWPPNMASYSQAPVLGSSALVYLNDGVLRARTYDGALDILLEQGVIGLYGPNPETCCLLR